MGEKFPWLDEDVPSQDRERPELFELASRFERAKIVEEAARLARVKIEEELTAASGFKKPEGQETYTAVDYSIEIKQPVNATINAGAWLKLRRKLPPKHPGRKIFVPAFKLDTKAARALQEEHPEAWADLSECITRKPGKIGVSVKRKET